MLAFGANLSPSEWKGFRLKTKSTAHAVDFSMKKCLEASIHLGLSHFFCYNRSIKVGDGDRIYDDFKYGKKT